MSEDNPPTGVATDLGMAAPAAPSVPPMSAAEAQSRKGEFFADRAKMDALMKGDVAATNEWQAIVAGLSAQPPAPTAPRDDVTEHLNASSGYTLAQDVLDEFREDRPVTPDEYRMARARFDARESDPQWVAKLNRGDLETKKELALIQSILSRRVRDPSTTQKGV
jgi:hypothetical protein